MEGKVDKGKLKVDPTKTKKKKQPLPYREPSGIHISKGQLDDVPARSSYSRLSHHLVPASTHVVSLHGSTATHSALIAMPLPSQYYQMTAGTYSHLPSSAVSSTSSHPRSHSDSTGSIGLTYLHLGGTPSGASDPPTPVRPPALVPQPGDRDAQRRRYIIPYGVGFCPMMKLQKFQLNAFVGTSKAIGPVQKRFENFIEMKCLKNFRNNSSGIQHITLLNGRIFIEDKNSE